jgi:LPPG:FO 2-phospho-L-lactate transferase
MLNHTSHKGLNVLLLAGGVGGAKAAEGLAKTGHKVTILGNIADDQEFHGLWVSPDIDTLVYSLASVIDRNQGWGLSGESHRVLDRLEKLGADTWMSLGDLDFATHIYRTQARKEGVLASEIAASIAQSFGVKTPILLPTNEVVQTQVETEDGWLSFQEYFVKKRCQPDVKAIRFEGIEQAKPTPEALAAIADADVIVFAPSNPIVSITPILNVPGIREAIKESAARKVAVSPFIAGKTVKGPADKMMASAGVDDGLLGVAQLYQGLVDDLVIDTQDSAFIDLLTQMKYGVLSRNILMQSLAQKQALMADVVNFASSKLDTNLQVAG